MKLILTKPKINNMEKKLNEFVSGSHSVNSEILDSQDFYEVMQRYRHSPIAGNHNVVKSFNEVKQWIRDNYR
jgi:hypothetical protein